jgi:molecular chaperone HscB
VAPSPFDVLGVSPQFDLDLKSLEARYRDLSRTLHPDRYVGKPKEERRLALDRAIEVNAAYRVLRDPVKRAEAMLRERAPELLKDERGDASPQLLMEMMETREALADAVGAKDTPRVRALGDDMRARETQVIARLATAFETPSDGALSNASHLIGELRYIRRFLDEVSAFEDALLDEASSSSPSA